MRADSPPTRAVSESRRAIHLRVGACSDVGRVRTNNEDAYRLAPEMGLFVLCDGMGGAACGELASKIVADTIVAQVREALPCSIQTAIPANGNGAGSPETAQAITQGAVRPTKLLGAAGELWDTAEHALARATSRVLAEAISRANEAVLEAAKSDPRRQGMGSTVVAVCVRGEAMSVAHAGDSRAYRLRAGRLEQLTTDHSFVAEQIRQGLMTRTQAEASALQSVLLRALGVAPEIEVDVREEKVQPGDAILLCSDGLTRELSDTQIASVLLEARDPQRSARELVRLANVAGGGDNITAVVVRIAAESANPLARLGRWFGIGRENGNGGEGLGRGR